MKRIVPILLALLLALTLVGCSSNKSASAMPQAAYSTYDSAYFEAEEAAMEQPAEYGYTGSGAPAQNPSQALSNRKIIRNADMSVETLTFDTFVDEMTAAVNAIGGYVESSSIGNRGYRNGQQLRYARYTIRIPADQLDAFLDTVSGLGNVTELNTGLRDVTTNYVDSEKHLEALRTEQAALLEILSKAETVEDIITVQDRLTYVSYEIESYESILRTYDDQIALSTVSMTVNEVEKETPVEKETFGQEVSRRFKNSLENVGDGFKSFGAWLFGEAPEIIVTLLILAAIVAVIILIIRAIVRGSKKRKEKAAAKKAEKLASAPEQK